MKKSELNLKPFNSKGNFNYLTNFAANQFEDIMSFTEQLNSDLKTAMKAKDMKKMAALRDIKSKIMLEATKEGATGEVDDAVVMKILNKLYKQRIEAAELYVSQDRQDLAQEENEQAEVIKAYLPEPMGADELKAIVQEIVNQVGASSMADMGKVMGIASGKLAGKADGKAISEVVKSILMG